MVIEEATLILAQLSAAYPSAYKNLSAEDAQATALVWAAQFADMPYDIVFMALQKAISTCKFPPTICEVKEKISHLYWEAYEVIQDYQFMGPELSGRDLSEYNRYKRIYELTSKFKVKNAEPELKVMLPYTENALIIGRLEEAKK